MKSIKRNYEIAVNINLSAENEQNPRKMESIKAVQRNRISNKLRRRKINSTTKNIVLQWINVAGLGKSTREMARRLLKIFMKPSRNTAKELFRKKKGNISI